jgi:type IV secretion system protein VirB2
MKNNAQNTAKISAGNSNLMFYVLSFALASLTFAEPAFATLTVGVTMLSQVISWLTLIAGAVATVAFMFIGYRMMFAAAQWKDVSPIFWGAIIIGAAASIAAIVAP